MPVRQLTEEGGDACRPDKLIDAIYRRLGDFSTLADALEPVRLWVGASWVGELPCGAAKSQEPPTPLARGQGWVADERNASTLPGHSGIKGPVTCLSFGKAGTIAFHWREPSGTVRKQGATRLLRIAPELVRLVAIGELLTALAEDETVPAKLVLALASPAGLLTGTGEVVCWNHPAILLGAHLAYPLPERGSVIWPGETRKAVRLGSSTITTEQGLIARLACLHETNRAGFSVVGNYGQVNVLVVLDGAEVPEGHGHALTASESDVLALLQAGKSVEEIAVARQTSMGTVRQQIKRLRIKVGRHSIAGLAALQAGAARNPSDANQK